MRKKKLVKKLIKELFKIREIQLYRDDSDSDVKIMSKAETMIPHLKTIRIIRTIFKVKKKITMKKKATK